MDHDIQLGYKSFNLEAVLASLDGDDGAAKRTE